MLHEFFDTLHHLDVIVRAGSVVLTLLFPGILIGLWSLLPGAKSETDQSMDDAPSGAPGS